MRFRSTLTAALGACLLVAGALAAEPARAPSIEDPVKAAYLYQFARFVEWPPEGPLSHGSLRICAMGPDSFVRALQQATQDKRAAARLIEAHAVRRTDDLRRCSIVFVDAGQNGAADEILRRLAGSHTLVVGEAPGFARRGGAIGFVVEDNRVRFEINVQAAQAAGLRVSARLLKIARLVDAATPEGAGR